MDNYSKVIAGNISKYRKINGYTQEDLAEKLGLSFQAVSKWENEQSCPDILLLPQIAEVFGISIDQLFGIEVVKAQTQTQHEHIPALPWPDDNVIRGVVFLGHKILDTCDDMSKFTFKLEGSPLNVISHCNIECGDIQNDAQAGCDINCSAINGSASAGCDINCSGDISGGAKAGCDIEAQEISGGAAAGGDINAQGISGGVTAEGDISVGDKIAGAVICNGDLTCHIIEGDVTCNGDITCESSSICFHTRE